MERFLPFLTVAAIAAGSALVKGSQNTARRPGPRRGGSANPLVDLSRHDLEHLFRRALGEWGRVDLTLPKSIRDFGDPPTPNEGVAYINLLDRTIHVNYGWLADYQILDTLPAVYAHEIGHHFRYPATLENEAQLSLLRGSLWPKNLPNPGLENLFEDLLINWALVQKNKIYADMFRRIYVAPMRPVEGPSPIFGFFLGCQEYFYGMPQGSITGPTPFLDQKMRDWRSTIARFSDPFLFGLQGKDVRQYRLFLKTLIPFAELERRDPPPPPEPPEDPPGPIASVAYRAAESAYNIGMGLALRGDPSRSFPVITEAIAAAKQADEAERRQDPSAAVKFAARAAEALAELARLTATFGAGSPNRRGQGRPGRRRSR